MSDDLPAGSRGGIAIRHYFPLDGEYSFKLRMQRNTIGDTIRGIDSAHDIQVRIDYGLVRRFTVGGKYKGYDPGLVNGAPAAEPDGSCSSRITNAGDHSIVSSARPMPDSKPPSRLPNRYRSRSSSTSALVTGRR